MKDDVISRQTAIEALKICDTNEDGKICHICPMRDERWDGAWEDNETICYKKLMRDSAKLLAMSSAQPEQPEWVQAVERWYNKALCNPCIHKPLAWALYQVWKEYDNEG